MTQRTSSLATSTSEPYGERHEPKLRIPPGGYGHARAASSAPEASSMWGNMIRSASASRARWARELSPYDMRSRGDTPWTIKRKQSSGRSGCVDWPCCISMKAQSKPALAACPTAYACGMLTAVPMAVFLSAKTDSTGLDVGLLLLDGGTVATRN